MEYIIDAKPEIKNIDMDVFLLIKNKIEKNVLLTSKEREIFLDYYISNSRDILSKYLNIDIMLDPLTNRCDLAQHIIGKMLTRNKNVVVFPKETQNIFYPTCKGHSFLVCLIQDIPYLIDLTYRQFFLKENCNESNYLILNNKIIKTPDPGFFIVKDSDASKVASKIISNGYVELNPSVAKIYGDAFYYTKTGDKETFNISAQIYFKNLVKENYDYAIDDSRFEEMYGKVI